MRFVRRQYFVYCGAKLYKTTPSPQPKALFNLFIIILNNRWLYKKKTIAVPCYGLWSYTN